MNIDPKEVKEELKELRRLSNISNHYGAQRTIQDAINLINQMQADLRRQGFHEYNDKEEQN